MSDRERKTIFVSFPSFFQELSLIRTGLLDSLLRKGYYLVIIVGNEPQKRRLEEHFHKTKVEVGVFNYRKNIEKIIEKFLYFKYLKKMPPNRSKVLKSSWKKGFRYRIVRIIAIIFVNFIPEKTLLWIQNNIFSKKEFNGLFLKYKPNLVVISWAGAHDPGRVLIRSAKKYKCKTISIDACWDIMEDATWIPVLDKLLVWNDFMKQEAVKYHGYPEERISTVGPLRCDFYRRKDLYLEKEEFFKRYELDPNKKLITLATNSAGRLELYVQIIHLILKAFCAKYPVQLFVRLDPHMYQEALNEFLNQPLVHIENSFTQERLINENDVINLVSLLVHTDVFISVLSTLILESCYFDKPNISLGFESLKPLYNRDFIQPLFTQKGVKIVHNEEELIKAIDNYLTNPDLDNEGRKNILKNLCFGGDGKVTERVLCEIEVLLNEK